MTVLLIVFNLVIEVIQNIKSVRIRSFSGPYSIWMWGNTDQKNSEYGHFSRSESLNENFISGRTRFVDT